MLLLPCAALAAPVDMPSEQLVLKDWLSPFRYYKCDGCSDTAKNFQTFTIDAAKIPADNLNSLPSHIYYRVLVAADGTEQVIDQFYFRGNESSWSAPETLKPPSIGGTYIPATVTRYRNTKTLPAKTVDAAPGTYRLEIRHIEISAATVANYLKTNSDDRKLTRNSIIEIYGSSALTVFQRDGYSSNYGSGYTDKTFYPYTVCNGPIWSEQATSYTNYPYGTVSYHMEHHCYSLYLAHGAIKLSKLAKTEKAYSLTVENPPPEPPSSEISVGASVGPAGSPFITGAGDQKTGPAGGGMAVAMLAGIGGVAAIGASYSLARPPGRPKLTVVTDNLTNYARNFAAELEESITASVTSLKTSLKETEKWANGQVNRAKKAQEAEDARRRQSEHGGGIPLKKVGDSYFRADTGAYWDTVPAVPVFANGWSYSGGEVTARPPYVEPQGPRTGWGGVEVETSTGWKETKTVEGTPMPMAGRGPVPEPVPTPVPMPVSAAGGGKNRQDISETASPNGIIDGVGTVLGLLDPMFGMVGNVDLRFTRTLPDAAEGIYKGAVRGLRGVGDAIFGVGETVGKGAKMLSGAIAIVGVAIDAPGAISTGVETGQRVLDETGNKPLAQVTGAAATGTYLVVKPIVDTAMVISQGIIGAGIIAARTVGMNDLATGIYDRWDAHDEAGTFNGLDAARIENTFAGAANAASNAYNSAVSWLGF